MNPERIKGIIMQNLYQLRHSLEEILDAFFFPTLDMIVWGFMTMYFANLRGQIGGVVAFLMGGLILWNIVWRAQQDISIAFLRDVWNRNIINLFSTPLTPWEFLGGTMLLGLIKIIFTLFVVSGLAFFLYSFNIFSLGFLLIPFFLNLIAFAWSVGFFITGLIIRYGYRIQSLAWGMIALFNPVSAVFYPVSTLPGILQKIALALPTAHIFEGMRQVLGNKGIPIDHLIWAFILNVIYLAITAVFFMYMFEKSRQAGKLANVES